MRHRSLRYSYALARAILVVLCTGSAASGADLLVNMIPSPTTVIAGANVTYTIRVDNNAFDDALNVVLTAALPPGSVFVTVTPPSGATCTYPASNTCNLGTIAGGGSVTVVLVLTLNTPPSSTNTASVTTTSTDTDPTNNSISKTVTVVAGADLTVTNKTGTPDPVLAGGTVTYTIATQNLGPQSATSITVTDTLPAGTNYVASSAGGTGWACSNSGLIVTCTRPGPVAIGVLPNITLMARPQVNGTVTNSVTIGSAVADPQPINNTRTLNTTVSPGTDMSVTKTVLPTTAATGGSVVWTIVPRNRGPLSTTNVTVSDPLPAGLTFVSVAPAQCTYDVPTHTVNCLFPGPVASATDLPSVVITTTATAAGTFPNVVTVGSALADPGPTVNTATRSVTVLAVGSDLQTIKSVNLPFVSVGSNMIYSVTVRNNGPSDVPAGATVTMTDTLPAGVTFVSTSAALPWVCSFSAGTVTCTRTLAVPLGPAASTPAVTITVRADTAGSISNTACASATGTAGDPTAGNNCNVPAATNTATAAIADLVITKSGAPGSVASGFPLTYTLTVTNNGPDPAASVVVTDTLSSATVLSATSTVGACTATSPVSCTLGNMANGASAIMTLQIRPLNGVGTRANTAAVTSQTGDPVLTNNSATLSPATTITAGVDLRTTKIVTPTTVPQGAQVTFVITTRNAAAPPVTATGVTMTDTLPANIRLVSVTPSAGSCPTVPPLNTPLLTSTTLICTIGTLNSNTQQTVTVIAEPTTTGNYVNTATSIANQPDGISTGDIPNASFTATAAQVDLSVIKIDNLDPVAVGTNFNYLITVVNNGPSRANNVVLTENIPPQFAFVSISTSKGSCSGTGPITCSFADLANGESVALTLTMTASTLGSFTNQASVSSAETDTNLLNNTTSEQTTAKQAADLSITKTGTPTPVRLNENITFTLTVSNAGPAGSALTNVTDTLPANLTLVSATPSQGTCAAGNPINCALGLVANGGNATITVVVRASAVGAATNTATVSGSEPDSVPGNNSASFPYTVATIPDLTISKVHIGSSFPLGGTGTFTLTVQNVGGASTDGSTVTVADTLPAGYTPVSAAGTGWTCTVAAPNVSCTRSDVLANAASYLPISITVNVALNAAATLNNTAMVSGGGDNTPLNNDSTDTVTNAASSDLAITKTNGVATLVPGAATTYTIVVNSLGPSDANGTTVSDTPPVTLTGVTWTCVGSTGAVCPAASGSGAIAATVAVFPAGGVLTYALSGTVSAGATGTLVNTASATAPAGVTDPTPANNSATDTDTLTPTANLGITKTSAPDPYVAVAALTYTITVTNAGPSDVTGASISDTVPASLSTFTWTCTSPSGACGTGAGNIAATVTLLSGQSATITLSGTMPAGTTGQIVNTASVTASSGVTDPTPGNNASTNTNPTGPTADLQVTKTNAVTAVTAGGATTYTIVASNAGTSAVVAAMVTDTAPLGLTFGTWTCAASVGSACPATGSGDLSVAVNLLAGGTATFMVPATISSTATSPLTNTATIAVPGGISDPAPGNNSASDTDTVSAPPSAIADLIVTKTDGVASVSAAGTTIYTVVVTNNGPDGAANAVVTDPAATGLTKTAVICAAASGAVCPASPTVVQLESGLTIPTFPTGGSVTLLITATVTAASGSVSNTVMVAAPAGVTDPTPANNSATDTDTVGVGGPPADVSVTKTNGTANVTSGGTTIYTIVVANGGPTAADGAVVTDLAAAGLTKTVVTCTAASGAVCPASPTVAQLESRMPIPTLPTGGSVTLLVTATVTAASGSVINTVTVAPPAGVADPTPANNSATDTDTVGAGVLQADLSVTKTNGSTSVTWPGTTTYTIVVANAGPAAADGAVVTDLVAAGLTKSAISCAAAGGAVCPVNPTIALMESGLTIPTLPSGGSVTLMVTASVTAVGGSVSNTVTVAPPAGAIDPAPGNNSATDVDAVGISTDVSVTKTNGVTTVTSGSTTTYTIVVANAGLAAADGVVLADSATAGLTKTAVSCVEASGAVCSASPTIAQLESGLTIPTLPAGGIVTLIVAASVTAASGSVSNTVTLALPAGVTDPAPGNNSATDTDTAGPALGADLSVTKTDRHFEVVPGQVLTYTIVVRNAGPGAVAGAMLNDPAPAALSFGSWTCIATSGSSCVSKGSGSLSTPVSLAVRGTATFTVIATVAANATGTFQNTATVTTPAGVADPVGGNNSATDSDRVATQQVEVETRAGTPTIVGPSTFEIPYTVTIVNSGKVPLTNTQVSDSLSAAFAAGNPTLTLAAPLSAAPTGGATASQCAVNGAFTGLGPTPSTATNLLVGTTSLAVKQGCTLMFTARVAYRTQAEVPRDAQVNRAEAWTSATPGGSRLASDMSEAEAVLRVPRVDITKALTAVTQVGDEPVFDVSYAFVVRNTAEIPASNVQVIEDLATTFAAGTPTITVESGPALGGGDGALTLATDFNGTTHTSLLTGTDVLTPGSSRALTLTVRLRFASAREIPEGQDVDNTARVTTSVTAGGIVISGDDSTDVTESGASPQADDEPRTTAVRFAPRARLSVQMTASTRVVEVGDTLSYAIRVANLGGPTLPLTILTDLLPLGFRYVPGSTRMAAGAATPQPMADPPGSPGPSLAFTIPAQPTSDEVTLIFRARVGPGALQGSGVNTAEAVTLGTGAIRSNVARAGVVISGGVFTPDACVIGKIFADGNGNHVQDDEELGIPGVQVRFEEGTVLVSDVEGKYSYCGLTPATHVLKVDRLTLPAGARLTESGNRNAGDAGSLFVDLKFGEVHRADFVEGSADPRVLEQIVARRARGEVWEPSFEGSPTSTLTQRGRAANQQPIPLVLGAPIPAPDAGVPADAAREVVLGVSGSEPLAPDAAARGVGVIRLSADRNEESADGITPVRLTIRLMDPDGVPVENTTSATIEVSGGQLQFADHRTAEAGFESVDVIPATQIRIEHGVGVVELIAPATAQDVRVRVTAGDASVEGTLTFLPHSRPMLAIGLVEGQVALTRVDASAVTPVRASEAFDRELHRFSRDFSNGQGQVGGRAALFLKGSVKGDYLLTLAYDSEKEDRGVLFRDIQPEAFYPIYGDSSLKGFDAQTSGRFYLRAERGRSYLLYGDLQTAGFSPEARNLGTYSRTLTGAQEHFENNTVVANVFVSRDSLTQVIDEIAGLGISGPYSVSNANGVSGTEKVEIVTRDRNQPAVILSAVPLTRFTDYEFEPFSGRLLFRRPVPAVDERLNPMSVRVTYEVDRGGEKSWVGGVDGQVKLGRLVQLGGSWAEDRAPGAPYRLRSVNSTLRIGDTTTMVAEGAQTIGTVNTTTFNQSGLFNLAQATGAVAGFAGRVELLHDSSRASARIFAGTSDPGFNNPASTLTGGRTELGGRGTLTVSEPLRVVGEAIRSEDRLTGGHREGAFLAVEAKFAHNLALEVGVRRARESLAPAQGTSVGVSLFGEAGSGGSFGFGPATGGNIDPITGLPLVNPGLAPQLSATSDAPQSPEAIDVFTVRGKLTYALAEALNVYGEAEQDVRDSDKKLAALGGQLRMTERTRLYLRHEFISSLDGPYALSNRQRSYRTVFGVSSTYLTNADVFSEYRMRDAVSGREAHAAIGLRNLWPLAEGIALSTSFERLHAIAGLDQAATAASVGLEYTRNPRLKSTGRVEWRHDTSSDSWLSTAGVARKVSRDWTLLSKNYFQLTAPRTGPQQVQNRFWLGGAYRDTATNRVNLLSRYEFRFEDTLGLPFGIGALREVHSVSTHVDLHPMRAWTLFGQHALKWVHDRTEEPQSRFMTQLVSGRIGYDVSKRIDLGALASVMWSGAEGGRRDALGGEVGFLLRNNLWLSLGYNITGFVDRDMVAAEQTTRGAFVRMRMKFDENLFGRDDVAARTARRP